MVNNFYILIALVTLKKNFFPQLSKYIHHLNLLKVNNLNVLIKQIKKRSFINEDKLQYRDNIHLLLIVTIFFFFFLILNPFNFYSIILSEKLELFTLKEILSENNNRKL